jgi:hypothetical protein
MNLPEASQQVDQQTQGIAGAERQALQNVQASQAPGAPNQPSNSAYVTQQAKPFPVVKLLLIIFTPGILLIVTMMVQVLAKFLVSGVSEGGGGGAVIVKIINLLSLLLGAFAVIGFILMPIAIILLIVKHSRK